MTSSNILGQQSAMTDPKGFMSSSLMFNFEGTPQNGEPVPGPPESGCAKRNGFWGKGKKA